MAATAHRPGQPSPGWLSSDMAQPRAQSAANKVEVMPGRQSSPVSRRRRGGRPSLQGDSGLPDLLPGEHVQAPWSIFRASSKPERREARNEGLVGAQASDQLLQIGAQAPGYPAVYMEKNGSTSGGSGESQG